MIRKFAVLMLLLLVPEIAYSADVAALEREALILRVELNRLGSSGDPFERETILRSIIDKCKGTEEGEAAYWDLADLYLDGFPEEMRQEACEMLELCLRAYPKSNRAAMIKGRLIDLYDSGNTRRAELLKQLQNDKQLPNIIRTFMN